jgi:hypothetical protein
VRSGATAQPTCSLSLRALRCRSPSLECDPMRNGSLRIGAHRALPASPPAVPRVCSLCGLPSVYITSEPRKLHSLFASGLRESGDAVEREPSRHAQARSRKSTKTPCWRRSSSPTMERRRSCEATRTHAGRHRDTRCSLHFPVMTSTTTSGECANWFVSTPVRAARLL